MKDEQTNGNDAVSRKGASNTTNMMLIIIAVLVVMSGIQVFQTQKLLNTLSNGVIKTSAQSQSNSLGIQSQVGGCG